jgi:hypothetical protein
MQPVQKRTSDTAKQKSRIFGRLSGLLSHYAPFDLAFQYTFPLLRYYNLLLYTHLFRLRLHSLISILESARDASKHGAFS